MPQALSPTIGQVDLIDPNQLINAKISQMYNNQLINKINNAPLFKQNQNPAATPVPPPPPPPAWANQVRDQIQPVITGTATPPTATPVTPPAPPAWAAGAIARAQAGNTSPSGGRSSPAPSVRMARGGPVYQRRGYDDGGGVMEVPEVSLSGPGGVHNVMKKFKASDLNNPNKNPLNDPGVRGDVQPGGGYARGGPVRRGYADGGAASPAPTYGMAKQYAAQHSQQEPTWGGTYAPQASSPGPAAVAAPASPPSGGGAPPVITPQSIAPQQQQSAPASTPAAATPAAASTTTTGNDGFVYSNPLGQNNFTGTPWQGTPSYVNGNYAAGGPVKPKPRAPGEDDTVYDSTATAWRGVDPYQASMAGRDDAPTGYAKGGPVRRLRPRKQAPAQFNTEDLYQRDPMLGPYEGLSDEERNFKLDLAMAQAKHPNLRHEPNTSSDMLGPYEGMSDSERRFKLKLAIAKAQYPNAKFGDSSGYDDDLAQRAAIVDSNKQGPAADNQLAPVEPEDNERFNYAEGGEVEDIDTGPDIDTGYAAGGRDPTLDYAMGGSDQDAVDASMSTAMQRESQDPEEDPQDPQDQPQKPKQKKPFKPKMRRPKLARMAKGRRRRPASQVTGYAAGGAVRDYDDGGEVASDIDPDTQRRQREEMEAALAKQQAEEAKQQAEAVAANKITRQDDTTPKEGARSEAPTSAEASQKTDTAEVPTAGYDPDSELQTGANEQVRQALEHARAQHGLGSNIAGDEQPASVPTGDEALPALTEQPYYGSGRQHVPRNQPGSDEPSADRSTFSLAGQAAQKGLESAGRSVADSVTGFFKNPPGAVDVDVAGALGSANDAIKQKLLDYINGTDGHPPEVSQAAVEKIKAETGLDHNDASHKAIVDYVNAGDMESAHKQIQGYKQLYEPLVRRAQGAANQGDLQEAARLATEAHQHVPDNRKVTYEVTPGKNVLATINDGSGTPKYATLTAQQFHDYLVGPGTNFDHQIENGIEKNLDIAARQPEAPEHAGQIRIDKTTGYGGDERQAPRQEETPRTTGYGGNGADAAMVRPTPNAGTDQGIVRSTPNAGTDQGILRPAPNASPANVVQARDTADRVLSAPAAPAAERQTPVVPKYTAKDLQEFGWSGQTAHDIEKAGGLAKYGAPILARHLPQGFFNDPKNMQNLENYMSKMPHWHDNIINPDTKQRVPGATGDEYNHLQTFQGQRDIAQKLLDQANNYKAPTEQREPSPLLSRMASKDADGDWSNKPTATGAPGSKLGIPTGVDAPLVPKEIEQARNMPELKVMRDPGLLQHLPEGYFNAPESRAALARVQEYYSGYGGGMARVFPNTDSGNRDLADRLLRLSNPNLSTSALPRTVDRITDADGRDISSITGTGGVVYNNQPRNQPQQTGAQTQVQRQVDRMIGNTQGPNPPSRRGDTAYERAQRGPTDYNPSPETLDYVARGLGVPQQPGASRPEPQPGTPGYIRPDDPRLYKQPPSQPARPEVGTLSTDPRRQGPESRLDDQPPSWPRPGPQGEATYPGGLKMVPTTDPRYRNLVGPNGETIGSSVPANRDLAPHEVSEMYYKHNQQQAENRLRLGDPVAVQALTVDRNKLYQPLPPPQQPTAESRAIARDYLVKNNIIHPDSPILGGGGAGGGNISSQPPRPTGNKLQDDYNFKVWQQQRIAETSQASRQQQASIAASRDMTVHQQQELINIREAEKAQIPLTPIQKQIKELHQQKTLELMQGGGGQNGGGAIRVNSVQEAMQLPHGTHIILPDGSPGVVP